MPIVQFSFSLKNVFFSDAGDEGDWVAVKPRLAICEEDFIDCKDARNKYGSVALIKTYLSWFFV